LLLALRPGCKVALYAPVSKAWIFAKYWLPVLVCMGLIFCASSDQHSFQHSSRLIAPLLRWLFPQISEESTHAVVVAARKGAHLTEYAILALLLWRAFRQQSAKEEDLWSWTLMIQTLLLVALFAASDEFHQKFVPTREASVVDVLIDSTGGFLALLFLWVAGRWRQTW
jgi:VanZ family protein